MREALSRRNEAESLLAREYLKYVSVDGNL